jgi:hypothetical protein
MSLFELRGLALRIRRSLCTASEPKHFHFLTRPRAPSQPPSPSTFISSNQPRPCTSLAFSSAAPHHAYGVSGRDAGGVDGAAVRPRCAGGVQAGRPVDLRPAGVDGDVV